MHNIRYWVAVWVVFALVFLAYLPGLSGPFIFDDFPNIVNNEVLAIDKWSLPSLVDAAYSMKAGPLYRPVAMSSFAVNYLMAGLDPWAYKLTNVVIHALGAIIIVALVWSLMLGVRRRYPHLSWLGAAECAQIALLAGALWGLHPFNLTSVLYVVQRMASLAGVLTMLALALYCWGRNRLQAGYNGWWQIIFACIIVFPLAVLTKENALVWPLLVVTIEWLIYGFVARNSLERMLFRSGCALTLLVYLAVVGWMFFNPQWVTGGYLHRDFNLYERVLTETRVLWYYIYWIVIPYINNYGLYHDDIVLSTGIFSPWSTFVALLAWCLVCGVALILYRRFPWLLLSVLFYFICHSIESTVIGLELVHEHRNYVAMLAIVVPFSVFLVRAKFFFREVRLLWSGMACVVVVMFVTTNARAERWGNWSSLTWSNVVNHPASPRANYEAGLWYFSDILQSKDDNHDESETHARKYFDRVTAYDPKSISGLIGNLRLRSLREEALTLDDPEVVELLRRLRTVPLGESKARHLLEWVACYQRGDCVLQQDVVIALILTALENPATASRIKARLNNEYGILLFKLKDMMAPYYFVRAIELEPGIGEYWVSLIICLVEMGSYDEARRAYSDFKQQNNFSRYFSRLDHFKEILEAS